MIDETGISLSVSDPDNMNDPAALGDGGLGDAEDYCSAELMHGDEITHLLRLSGSPSQRVQAGLRAPKQKKSGTVQVGMGTGGKHYLILFGVIVVILVGVVILNSERG